MRERDINIALLISGEGTTAEAVIRACQRGEIARIQPVVVISSRPDAAGLARAEALSVPTAVMQRKDFASVEAFGEALLAELQRHGVDLVSQNGWLPRTPQNVIKAYRGHIINQHPGRLPAFGGKGMFGARVTCATLTYFELTDDQDPWTASVVHRVTAAYDEGPLSTTTSKASWRHSATGWYRQRRLTMPSFMMNYYKPRKRKRYNCFRTGSYGKTIGCWFRREGTCAGVEDFTGCTAA